MHSWLNFQRLGYIFWITELKLEHVLLVLCVPVNPEWKFFPQTVSMRNLITNMLDCLKDYLIVH